MEKGSEQSNFSTVNCEVWAFFYRGHRIGGTEWDFLMNASISGLFALSIFKEPCCEAKLNYRTGKISKKLALW